MAAAAAALISAAACCAIISAACALCRGSLHHSTQAHHCTLRLLAVNTLLLPALTACSSWEAPRHHRTQHASYAGALHAALACSYLQHLPWL